ADVEAGERIAAGIDGGAGDAGGLIAASNHVAEDALARLGGVDGAGESAGLMRAQILEIHEEESFVLAVIVRQADGTADAEAGDLLHELALAHLVGIVGPFVGVEAGRAVEEEALAVKLVGSR